MGKTINIHEKNNNNNKNTETNTTNETGILTQKIEGTPITIVEDEKGKFLTIGNYNLGYKTDEEIENEIKQPSWMAILTMFEIILTQKNQ
jgi:hypothetical protein